MDIFHSPVDGIQYYDYHNGKNEMTKKKKRKLNGILWIGFAGRMIRT